jgi:hypothetical protein
VQEILALHEVRVHPHIFRVDGINGYLAYAKIADERRLAAIPSCQNLEDVKNEETCD